MNEIKDMAKAERAEMWQQVAAYVEQLEQANAHQRAQIKRCHERIRKMEHRRAERTCKRVATTAKIPTDPYGLNLKTRHVCSECNTEIMPWFRYCEFCGAKVVE